MRSNHRTPDQVSVSFSRKVRAELERRSRPPRQPPGSIAELARLVGCSLTTMTRLVNLDLRKPEDFAHGISRWPLAVLTQVAQVLDIRLELVFGEAMTATRNGTKKTPDPGKGG